MFQCRVQEFYFPKVQEKYFPFTIAQLSAQSTFKTACEAVNDALSCDAYDIDSLVAMYDRITKVTPLMPDLPTVHQIPSPNIRFDSDRYDRMLQGVRR